MAKKQIKGGVRRGGGPDPGFEWNVDILDLAYHEACDFLNNDQYRHLADQFQLLAMQRDPTHSQEISLDAIEDFYELRDWGGILVLGAIDKRNNGPTPLGDKLRVRRRWREYLRGEYD